MKHSGQTVLWELWAALCLCTALALPPGDISLEGNCLFPGRLRLGRPVATVSFS